MRPVVAEINLGAYANNIKELNRIKNSNALFMAVVKADGYGHGAIPVAKTAVRYGADYLAVSMLEEAIELREAGINVPILVFGWTAPEDEHLLFEFNLIQTIFNYEQATSLSRTAANLNKSAKIHLKIDTGMGRVGFKAEPEKVKEIIKIFHLPGLKVEGIFTHFADADNEDSDFTKRQFDKFINFVEEIESHGRNIAIKHCSNSAAIINYPEMHLDMVRAGISTYGLYPNQSMRDKLKLKEVMSLKAEIISIKELSAGDSVSYGRTYFAKEKMQVATLPLGYADGYSRLLSNKARVIVKDEFVPVVGRVCMDQFMIDVSDVSKNLKIGDEVVMFGSAPEGKKISINEIADLMGTISYEVICLVGNRVPRIYVNIPKNI